MPSDRELGARIDMTLLSPVSVWDQSASMATVQKSNAKRSASPSSLQWYLLQPHTVEQCQSQESLDRFPCPGWLSLGQQWHHLGQKDCVSRTKEGVGEHS